MRPLSPIRVSCSSVSTEMDPLESVMQVPNRHNPIVRPLQLEDYLRSADFLLSFRAQHREREYWLERFSFWWENNPFFKDSMVRGWLLVAEGKVVGFLGSIPLSYQWNHEPCQAMTPTTWYVLPEYRQFALSLFLEQLDAAENALLWDATPTEQVRAISLSLGFTPVAYSCRRACYVFKDMASILDWHLRTRGMESWWPARLRRLTSFWPGKLAPVNRLPSGYAVRILPDAAAVDASFDQLWERTRHLKAHTRIRSAQWVRWYCFGFNGQKKTLVACYRDDTLAAYGIFYRTSKRSSTTGALPGQFLECLDSWQDPDHPEAMELVLDHALERTRLENYLGLALFDFPVLTPWIEKKKYIVKKHATPGGLHRLPVSLQEGRQDGTPCFMLAEGDVGL